MQIPPGTDVKAHATVFNQSAANLNNLDAEAIKNEIRRDGI